MYTHTYIHLFVKLLADLITVSAKCEYVYMCVCVYKWLCVFVCMEITCCDRQDIVASYTAEHYKQIKRNICENRALIWQT